MNETGAGVVTPETPRRGRATRTEEMATMLKDLNALSAIAQRMGGYGNIRAALELLENQQKAA